MVQPNKVAAFFMLCFLSQSVSAYIDPGTGSLIFQLLLGSFVGLLFAVKMYWNRLKSFLKSKLMKGHGDETAKK